MSAAGEYQELLDTSSTPDPIAYLSIRIGAIVHCLIERGIVDKDEFNQVVMQATQQAEQIGSALKEQISHTFERVVEEAPRTLAQAVVQVMTAWLGTPPRRVFVANYDDYRVLHPHPRNVKDGWPATVGWIGYMAPHNKSARLLAVVIDDRIASKSPEDLSHVINPLLERFSSSRAGVFAMVSFLRHEGDQPTAFWNGLTAMSKEGLLESYFAQRE